MIDKLTIDFNNLPSSIEFIKGLKFKKEYKFKPGLNLIIGENGSGKTTLLNILSNLTFSTYGHTHIFSNIRRYDQLECIYSNVFDILGDKKMERYGLSISNNWNLPVLKYVDLRSQDTDAEYGINIAEHLFNKLDSGHYSNGELQTSSTNKFVMSAEKLVKSYKLSDVRGEVGHDEINKLINEYIDSTFTNKDPKVTFLMDEPDQGLDIIRLVGFSEFLAEYFVYHQAIVVVHNPALIYKLMDKANITEMSRGYLNKVIKFIEK